MTAVDVRALASLAHDYIEKIEADADPYELLGVPHDAKDDAIRNAFRERARVFHTDLYAAGVLDEYLLRDMQRVMGALSRSQAALLNPKQREDIDARRKLKERGIPTDVRQIFAADEAFRTGRRLLDRNALAQALGKFEEAAALNPGEAEYRMFLAWTRYCIGSASPGPSFERETDRFVEQIRALTVDAPKVDAAWVFLGHIARNRGQMKEAHEAYVTALKANPDNVEAQSGLRLVQKRATAAKNSNSGGFFAKLFGRG